jgi:hypothetical protein
MTVWMSNMREEEKSIISKRPTQMLIISTLKISKVSTLMKILIENIRILRLAAISNISIYAND